MTNDLSTVQPLRDRGLKPTLARLALWKLLHNADAPLSIQDMQRMVFQQKLGAPFNTLYMALRQMEEKGLVRRLRVDGETRAQYVLAEREQFSQSLVCSQCGAQQWVDDAEVRSAIEKLCHKRGLQLAQYQVNVQARCNACGAKNCVVPSRATKM